MTTRKKSRLLLLPVFATFLFLVIAVTAPLIWKEDIIKYVQTAANRNLNANVAFSDVNISLLRSFPDLQIQIDSLIVSGRDAFEGVDLLKAPSIEIDINLLSLFGSGKTPEISRLYAFKPEIQIVVLDSVQANYLITKPTTDTTTAAYHLALTEYAMEDASIRYHDHTLPLVIHARHMSHEGKGDFTQAIFDLDTQSTADSLSVEYNGITFVDQATATLDAGLTIQVQEQKVTFRNNTFRLNALSGAFNGFVQLVGDEIMTDMAFNTTQDDLKSILSVVPGAYSKQLETVSTSGKAGLNGVVRGKYNGITGSMPAFSLEVKVANGTIQYPALPRKLHDINADLLMKADKPDYSDLLVDLRNFSIRSGAEELSGRIYASNLTGNQKLEGSLKAAMQLKNLASALPLEQGTLLDGSIRGQLSFKATMADVNQKKYDQIYFDGTMTASDILLRMKETPEVRIGSGTLVASPSSLNLSCQNMKLGSSDLSLAVVVLNPLAVFSTNTSPAVDLQLSSDFFNANEWMTQAPSPTSDEQMVTLPNESLLEKSTLALHLKMNKILFNELTLQNVVVGGKLAANNMQIDQMKLAVSGSDIAISGTVSNAWDYLFEGGTLIGNVAIQSSVLNLNPFMSKNAPTSGATSTETIPVPDRIRLHGTADVGRLIYTNLDLTNVKGALDVADNQVALRDLTMGVFGGKLNMEGIYRTLQNKKPDYSMRLGLEKIPFQQAFTGFQSLARFAPITKHISGLFNANLVLDGELTNQMLPEWNTFNASGFIETLNALIKGFEPIAALSQETGIRELKEWELQNTKNWFDIKHGTVELKPVEFDCKEIQGHVGGRFGLDKSMDFTYYLAIPKSLLKANPVTASAMQAIGKLEKEAGKLGIPLQQHPFLYLKVTMAGTFPGIKWKVLPIKQAEFGQTKEELAAESPQDSLREQVKDKAAEWKDTLTSQVTKEVEKARGKARSEAEKMIDSVKSRTTREAGKQLDSIGKGIIPDTLRKKAKDILDKKTSQEVDKIKDKLKDFNPFKKKNNGGR